MMTFLVSLKWTDKGIREIRDTPNRVKVGRGLAKKVGIEIKHIYLTSGESDVLLIIDTPNGDAVAKFCLALGSLGNVHTRTARAWPEAEYLKLVSELP